VRLVVVVDRCQHSQQFEKRDPDEWTNLAGQTEFTERMATLARRLPEKNALPIARGRKDDTPDEDGSE
jgi:hypothetical protein